MSFNKATVQPPADAPHAVHVRVHISSHWKMPDGQLHGVASDQSDVIVVELSRPTKAIARQDMHLVASKIRALLESL